MVLHLTFVNVIALSEREKRRKWLKDNLLHSSFLYIDFAKRLLKLVGIFETREYHMSYVTLETVLFFLIEFLNETYIFFFIIVSFST